MVTARQVVLLSGVVLPAMTVPAVAQPSPSSWHEFPRGHSGATSFTVPCPPCFSLLSQLRC